MSKLVAGRRCSASLERVLSQSLIDEVRCESPSSSSINPAQNRPHLDGQPSEWEEKIEPVILMVTFEQSRCFRELQNDEGETI